VDLFYHRVVASVRCAGRIRDCASDCARVRVRVRVEVRVRNKSCTCTRLQNMKDTEL